MRIVALGEGDQEGLDHIFIALLVDALAELLVTLGHHLLGGIQGVLVETFLEKLCLDTISPELVGLVEIRRPRGFLAIDLHRLVT